MLTTEKQERYSRGDMLDTLGIYRRLKHARASESVSREIAKIFGEVVDHRVATRNDVRDLQLQLAVLDKDLKAEIANSRAETLRWIMGMLIAQSALLFSAIKVL